MEPKDCPHRIGRLDVDHCSIDDDGQTCVYETGDGPCETLEEMDDDTPEDNS